MLNPPLSYTIGLVMDIQGIIEISFTRLESPMLPNTYQLTQSTQVINAPFLVIPAVWRRTKFPKPLPIPVPQNANQSNATSPTVSKLMDMYRASAAAQSPPPLKRLPSDHVPSLPVADFPSPSMADRAIPESYLHQAVH